MKLQCTKQTATGMLQACGVTFGRLSLNAFLNFFFLNASGKINLSGALTVLIINSPLMILPDMKLNVCVCVCVVNCETLTTVYLYH